ncbi:MAG: cytochrome c biogenesis protein CcsA [Cytophagaceae bacterium]
MRAIIGDLGHLFVIISFVSSAIAAFSYWKASGEVLSAKGLSWKSFARANFFLHSFAVGGIIFSLFTIIYNHYYEYHYAWSHSSNNLPGHYMISCFWEGQEGSFLLWSFWNVILGLILIKVNKTWEAPLMAVFCFVQLFLSSMILGISLPGNIAIGSSPFILLKDYMGNIPIYQINPGYIPEDGTGLNPLLQNYWMVIHPPTLFLGFAATLVPFAYCIAGLWQKNYKEWIRPALPWALFASLTLGAGIIMGGYWAYETLNFGGYWNWDPVENAVFVPWLVLIGSIHTMITYRNSEKALKASIILVIATFILILYSTFLTRSGILGDSSVHSFTDLGLSGQLLIYLLAFVALSIYICWKNWKQITGKDEEISVYSREFWIFIGVCVLSLSAFQVLYTTSIPVYNKILSLFSIKSNMAPPADAMEHYSNFQIWFAIGIATLSAIGQFFWWKKIDNKKLLESIAIPLISTLLIACILFTLIIVYDIQGIKASYILLFTTSVFCVISNINILLKTVPNNYILSGGAMAHIGVGLMLAGILFSAGYSRVISLNNTGMIYSKSAGEEFNKDNILLWRNDWKRMQDFNILYKGPRLEAQNFPDYIKKEDLFLLDDKYKAIAKKNIKYKDDIYFRTGDTLSIYPENTYYEVLMARDNGDTFTLYPRAQVNPQMGLLASPDIKRFFNKDLYAHVSSIPAPEEEKEWSQPENYTAKIGDTIIINDFITILKDVERIEYIPGFPFESEDAAIKANLTILGNEDNYNVHPLYVLRMKEGIAAQIPDVNEDLGIRISLTGINPATGEFSLSVSTSQKDYIILKAIEKPMINFLWIGTFLLIGGFAIAMARRYSDFAKMRDKGQEI